MNVCIGFDRGNLHTSIKWPSLNEQEMKKTGRRKHILQYEDKGKKWNMNSQYENI